MVSIHEINEKIGIIFSIPKKNITINSEYLTIYIAVSLNLRIKC